MNVAEDVGGIYVQSLKVEFGNTSLELTNLMQVNGDSVVIAGNSLPNVRCACDLGDCQCTGEERCILNRSSGFSCGPTYDTTVADGCVPVNSNDGNIRGLHPLSIAAIAGGSVLLCLLCGLIVRCCYRTRYPFDISQYSAPVTLFKRKPVSITTINQVTEAALSQRDLIASADFFTPRTGYASRGTEGGIKK